MCSLMTFNYHSTAHNYYLKMLACRSNWLINSPDIFNTLSCKETGNENMGTGGCGLVITGNYRDWPTKN